MREFAQRKLKQARAAYHAGAFEKARVLCGEILRGAPRNAAALHLAGMTAARLGDNEAARELLRRAAEIDPRNASLAADLGACELAAGDCAQAAASLERAIALGECGVHVLSWLGVALARQDRHEAAAAAFGKAAAAAPDDAGLHLNLGHALSQAGRAGEAIESYERALRLKPDQAEAHNNLANALQALGRDAEAQAHLGRAIALEPRFAQAHYNLADLLQSQGQLDPAIGHYRRVLELDPGHVLAHHHLGTALLERGDAAAARASLEKALELDPGYAMPHVGLGAVALDEGDSEAALGHYQRALELEPGSADAQYGLALAHLFRGGFAQAWPLYDRRLHCEEVGPVLRDAATLAAFERAPRWDGSPGGETTVGIWSEQGIGDQLLFSTLIPELIAARVPFVYEVDARLIEAYRRSFPGERFVARTDPPQPVLLQAGRALLAGSLPALYRRSRADFARQPARLLQPSPGRVDLCRERVAGLGAGLKIALSWRSARADRVGPKKSVALQTLHPLLRVSGARFLDVQYGDTSAERDALAAAGVAIGHFDDVDYRDDLDELLAILEACDLVITTSNATAHLAGSIGKRAWLLFPAGVPPFHYWVADANGRSLWYPSVEIVSPRECRSWGALIEHAAQKLNALVVGR